MYVLNLTFNVFPFNFFYNINYKKISNNEHHEHAFVKHLLENLKMYKEFYIIITLICFPFEIQSYLLADVDNGISFGFPSYEGWLRLIAYEACSGEPTSV